MSAGFIVAGVIFIFCGTGLLRWFTHFIPTPVVKGIQVGAGLSLVISAGASLLQPLGWTTPNSADNLIWAIFVFVALLATQKAPRVPYALLIFLLGLGLSMFIAGTTHLPSLKIWHPQMFVPNWKSFRTGALDAGLGQIPLTTLNSIIAVCYLSADLMPHLPAPSVTAMGMSVALMNLVGGWFGAMPVCHGSGGLAAQYRFGARSGASIIMLGLFKVLLGLFFGETLVDLLRGYPKSLLGVMVIAAGLELAKVGESLNYGATDLWEVSESAEGSDHLDGHDSQNVLKRQRQLSEDDRKERWMVMLMTIGGLLAFKNDAVGFLAGMLWHWVYKYPNLRTDSEGWIWIRDGRRAGRGSQVRTLEEEEERLLLDD